MTGFARSQHAAIPESTGASAAIQPLPFPARPLPPNNLPVESTPPLGRDAETAALTALLARSDVQLISLTGTAGVGKTCLALHVARAVLDCFSDGVYLMNLAPLADPDLVLSGIAAALNLRESAGRELSHTLRQHLKASQTLLVLDNFEHLLPAAVAVAELLAHCPGLKVLATSREPLRLHHEHLFPVAPLAVPEPQRLPGTEALAEIPAVALFLRRAACVQPGFALTAQNAAAIAGIAICLDGLPLAIELAAARSRHLAPAALLALLSGRAPGQAPGAPIAHGPALKVLTGGPRDLPPRQQTIRGAIAWSYHLIESGEQRLFRSLAVFAGDFTLDAAAAVGCGGCEAIAVVDGLAALADKSLLRAGKPAAGDDVQRAGTANGTEPRYGMLQVVREFACEALSDPDEIREVRERFTGYYAEMARRAGAAWRSSEQVRWLEWLCFEEANVRQALDWLLGDDTGREQAVSMLLGLDQYWRQLTRISETRSRLEQALAASDGLQPVMLARLLSMTGCFTMMGGGEFEIVAGYHRRATRLARECGELELLSDVLEQYGADASKARRNDEAREAIEEALAIERTRGTDMTVRMATQINILAIVSYNLGEYARALALLEELAPFFRAHGPAQQLCSILVNSSNMARALGDYDKDGAYLREAWPILHARGDTMAHLEMLSSVAERAYRQGRSALAVRLHGAMDALSRQAGFTFPPAYRSEFDVYVANLRSQLTEADFDSAWAAGMELTLEQAIAEGLADAIPAVPAGVNTRRSASRPAPSTTAAMPARVQPDRHVTERGCGLSPRELEVAALLACGLTNEEIAARLSVVEKTVEKHVSSILAKLCLRNRTEVAAWVGGHGVGTGPQ